MAPVVVSSAVPCTVMAVGGIGWGDLVSNSNDKLETFGNANTSIEKSKCASRVAVRAALSNDPLASALSVTVSFAVTPASVLISLMTTGVKALAGTVQWPLESKHAEKSTGWIFGPAKLSRVEYMVTLPVNLEGIDMLILLFLQ